MLLEKPHFEATCFSLDSDEMLMLRKFHTNFADCLNFLSCHVKCVCKESIFHDFDIYSLRAVVHHKLF